MKSKAEKTLLIWDFDDTIVKTNIEFKKTKKNSAAIISNAIYGTEKKLEHLLDYQRRVDLRLVSTHGFLPQQYVDSWLKTYDYFAAKEKIPTLTTVKNKILDTAQNVYVRKYKEVPYAVSTLTKLKREGYPMILLTAGVESIQRRKIKEAGIEHLIDNIYVRINKTPETLRELLASYSANEYVMIGNSLKSDIYPALENNIWGIHIERQTWDADEHPIDKNHPKYIRINSIAEVPKKLKMIEKKLSLFV